MFYRISITYNVFSLLMLISRVVILCVIICVYKLSSYRSRRVRRVACILYVCVHRYNLDFISEGIKLIGKHTYVRVPIGGSHPFSNSLLKTKVIVPILDSQNTIVDSKGEKPNSTLYAIKRRKETVRVQVWTCGFITVSLARVL